MRIIERIGLVLTTAVILLIFSCGNRPGTGDIKFRQYFLKGEQLYALHCANCHQKNGKGLGLLYPPLDSSDYLTKYPDSVLCIIRNGVSGDLVVNGKIFNQPMPSFPALTDIEIAQLATYIHNSWSNQGKFTDVKEVSEKLSNCR
jgi:cytochrome c551